MGKAKKRPRNARKRSHRAAPKVGRRRFLLGSAGVIAAGLATAFGVYRFTGASSGQAQEDSFGPDDLAKLPRHEKRQTLSPTLFTGSVAAAYAVAKQVPALLDQLYCYCRCKENFGHQSLLSCYVDRHAST
jgi:hypothetical protein